MQDNVNASVVQEGLYCLPEAICIHKPICLIINIVRLSQTAQYRSTKMNRYTKETNSPQKGQAAKSLF